MNCQEAQKLLHAYIDGELDATGSIAVEQHIHTCPDCRQAHRAQLALRQVIATGAPYFKAPADLRSSILAATREAAASEQPSAHVSSQQPRRRSFFAAGLGMAACLAVGFFLAQDIGQPSAREVLVGEITSSHIRSLLAAHLMDVISTDQHTVKPWFDGKLDFSPPVHDLATDGYPLLGGRLDYIGGRTVSVLIYGKQKHYINLFVWPKESGSAPSQTYTRNGYNLVTWTDGGMTFWAVSDVNAADLQKFTGLIQSAVTPAPAH